MGGKYHGSRGMMKIQKGSEFIMHHDKPNILMIMADQLAFDVFGALGHTAVKTPNLDRLIAKGVVFNNCYCNSPLCTPSRASFVTGTYIRNNEVFDNGAELPASALTFMHHLRRAGYDTILSGKMHFVGPDQLHGFNERLTTDIYPSGLDWTPDWSQGAYPNPGTGVRRLRHSGTCDWNVQLTYDEEVLYRTLEKIRQLKAREEKKPFFLCASFTHPHCPFVITPEFWDLYDNTDIPMPTTPAQAFAELDAYNQWIQTHHECDICELTEDEIRNSRRAYYAMVSYFDHVAGQLIDELERTGQAENTVIVVTSDHGEMLGEHGMWFKRTYFDHAAKVPLIVSCPERFASGKTVSEVVSLVDLSATFMALGEVIDCDAWLNEMDGASLLGLLTGDASDWKDEALCEYYGEGAVHSMAMLRRGRYKYVYVQEHPPLLFDLIADPAETVNLATNPQYADLCDTMRAAIQPDLMQQMDKKVLDSQRQRLMLNESLAATGRTNWGWDYQPFFDAARQYIR